MTKVIFKNRKLHTKKLLAFGFERADEGYIYHADIVDGQMQLTVRADRNGTIYTEVIDNSTGDAYVLHLVPNAVGSFVGQVKAEYEAVLEEISKKCFDIEVFKSKQAKAVISYVKEAYGDEPEYLWQKFSDNAVVRRKDSKKWYVALLTVSKSKLGLFAEEPIEILDVRMKPEEIEKQVDNKKYFPGYHMNKKHWITICLDNSVPFEEICRRIDESYVLAVK